MGFFICGLWSCLASALTVRAIKNITMDDYDPRIIYSNSPDWRHETSDATLGRYNLTTHWTEALASASLKFNGTAVYFMSYGLLSPLPDQYHVTVDGQTEARSLRVANESERALFIAYSRTGLDASQEHQITISNPYYISLNVDAFIITVLDNNTAENGFGSSSSADIGDSKPSGGPGLTMGVKAGIAVGVIGGIILGVLAVLGISRWQRQGKLKTQDNSLDLVGEVEEGGPSAVIHPFVETPGGVQRRPGEFRKGRNPNFNTSRAPEAQGNVGEVLASPHRPLSSVTLPPPYAG